MATMLPAVGKTMFRPAASVAMSTSKVQERVPVVALCGTIFAPDAQAAHVQLTIEPPVESFHVPDLAVKRMYHEFPMPEVVGNHQLGEPSVPPGVPVWSFVMVPSGLKMRRACALVLVGF